MGKGEVLWGWWGGVCHVVGEGHEEEVRGGPWGNDGQEAVEGVGGRGIWAQVEWEDGAAGTDGSDDGNPAAVGGSGAVDGWLGEAGGDDYGGDGGQDGGVPLFRAGLGGVKDGAGGDGERWGRAWGGEARAGDGSGGGGKASGAEMWSRSWEAMKKSAENSREEVVASGAGAMVTAGKAEAIISLEKAR